jgi:hypothetical protein
LAQTGGFKGTPVAMVGKMSAAEDEEASGAFVVELLMQTRGKARERGSTWHWQLPCAEAEKKGKRDPARACGKEEGRGLGEQRMGLKVYSAG